MAGCALALQTRYAGDLPGCTAGSGARATLVRQADRFDFAPSDGALVISGRVSVDGRFAGSLITGTSRQGGDGRRDPPFTLVVTGRLDDEAAAGTYETPRCRADFRLPRIGASLLP